MTVDTSPVPEFESHRRRLFSLAYRMMGSAVEAEDAVQDTYLRWHSRRSPIDNPAAWLTTVLINVCRTRLTSARAQREVYVGPWLPEPILTGPGTSPMLDPQESAQQRESISLGILTLMERLTPAERAVFVLREAFGHEHHEISAILGVSEVGSRQLLRRARQRIGDDRPRFASSDEDSREVVSLFLQAANGGDLAAFENRLAEDVTATSDGGGKVTAGRRPVFGRDRVTRFLAGFVRMGARDYHLRFAPYAEALALTFAPEGQSTAVITTAEINSNPGLLALVEGTPVFVQQYSFHEGAVSQVFNINNPDKLGFIARQLHRSPHS